MSAGFWTIAAVIVGIPSAIFAIIGIASLFKKKAPDGKCIIKAAGLGDNGIREAAANSHEGDAIAKAIACIINANKGVIIDSLRTRAGELENKGIIQIKHGFACWIFNISNANEGNEIPVSIPIMLWKRVPQNGNSVEISATVKIDASEIQEELKSVLNGQKIKPLKINPSKVETVSVGTYNMTPVFEKITNS